MIDTQNIPEKQFHLEIQSLRLPTPPSSFEHSPHLPLCLLRRLPRTRRAPLVRPFLGGPSDITDCARWLGGGARGFLLQELSWGFGAAEDSLAVRRHCDWLFVSCSCGCVFELVLIWGDCKEWELGALYTFLHCCLRLCFVGALFSGWGEQWHCWFFFELEQVGPCKQCCAQVMKPRLLAWNQTASTAMPSKRKNAVDWYVEEALDALWEHVAEAIREMNGKSRPLKTKNLRESTRKAPQMRWAARLSPPETT